MAYGFRGPCGLCTYSHLGVRHNMCSLIRDRQSQLHRMPSVGCRGAVKQAHKPRRVCVPRPKSGGAPPGRKGWTAVQAEPRPASPRAFARKVVQQRGHEPLQTSPPVDFSLYNVQFCCCPASKLGSTNASSRHSQGSLNQVKLL